MRKTEKFYVIARESCATGNYRVQYRSKKPEYEDALEAASKELQKSPDSTIVIFEAVAEVELEPRDCKVRLLK